MRGEKMIEYDDAFHSMTLEEFIAELLKQSEEKVMPIFRVALMLDEAAKRLAEMDERISIMTEPKCGEDYCGIEE